MEKRSFLQKPKMAILIAILLMFPSGSADLVTCPDNKSCPSGNICCPLRESASYFCCPSGAVCCESKCCTQGYQCTEATGECIETVKKIPGHIPEHLGAKRQILWGGDILPANEYIPCDTATETGHCAYYQSCCPFGCCDYINATCCSNNVWCCESWQKCVGFGGFYCEPYLPPGVEQL